MVEQWCRKNRMLLNTSKSKCISFYPKNKNKRHPVKIFLKGDTLEQIDEYKLIGFTIRSDLSWKSHINLLEKKVKQNTALLKLLRFQIDTPTAQLFYHRYIQPHLINGIILWYNTSPQAMVQHLLCLQRAAIRVILRTPLSRKIRSETLARTAKILPFPQLAHIHSACFAHNIHITRAPSYLTHTFMKPNPTGRVTRNLYTLPSKLDYNIFHHALVRIFNSIPLQIRKLRSPHSFNHKTKALLWESLE